MVDALYGDTAGTSWEAELALFGLTPDDFAERLDGYDVWPDTLPAINTFIAMETQWRVGMAGATGMDYAALPAVLDLMDVPRDERSDLFADLRVMEGRALELMRKQND